MFRGSIVALATPFNLQGEVDFKTLSELIEWHIESGTDAIALCGITGEAPTVSQEETLQIFREGVLAAKGRIPLIAGTGSNDTAQAVQMTIEAKKAGVDAALVILPYYNRPTEEGCYRHFQELSHIDLPLIAYHHPGRTGTRLPVKALARISKLPNIVAIKESTGDLDYTIELMHQTQTPILCGDDTLVLPLMASGAIGVISIVANIIPREWKILTTLMLADQVGEGRDFFNRYYSLVKSMTLEINPQCVKYALSTLGRCLPSLRLPLIEPQELVKQEIVTQMIKARLLFLSESALAKYT